MIHTPLDIRNTSNCNPNPWHPSVVYISAGLGGHTWWMAQTPFPPTDEVEPYRDRWELPCIHYSDDGIHWNPIEGNPIDDITEEDIDQHNYLSDTHLIYRDGTMECYYRKTFLSNKQIEGNTTQLLRKTSMDGVRWSECEVLADLRNETDKAIWGEQIISQAVVWDGQNYHCWYVDRDNFRYGRKIRMSTSSDGIHWCQNVVCELSGYEMDPWHIDIQRYNGKYQMIVYDMWNLLWYESADGLKFKYVSKILQPTKYVLDYYADELYRACLVKVGKDFSVYFSARNADHSFLGLIQTDDRKHFAVINGMDKWTYITRYIIPKINIKDIGRIIKHLFRPIKKLWLTE